MEEDGRYRVLVCEDDGLLRTTLERGLRRAGYLVDPVSTGGAAVRTAATSPPDAVVLDIGLPDADGRDVCQALRAQGCTAGVVFLTARHHTDDVLSGFAVGGDDYVRKPFEFAELLARVAGVIRRRPYMATQAEPGPEDERLQVDPATHSIRYGDSEVSLSPTEFRFLACLISRRPEVVRRAELVAAGWPGALHVGENTLDQYVTRARRKLAQIDFPQTLENVRGVGYRLR
ncbi:response regulator transcription factor [Kineosporia succinea]|uniref:Two-component system response regulator MprA n=1 Tax=Kineosporia succinea TaxID=84632 RepID=A0ABT9PDW3_9ACTN|nr:response regulator transcription factor [Kineosporia succinea]MDP9830355.1 two-component system response regulator MprA [Kineosporia succinea]